MPGYDSPLLRDWLFKGALALSVAGGLVIVLTGDSWWSWVKAGATVYGGVFLTGIWAGSVRGFIRGYREG